MKQILERGSPLEEAGPRSIVGFEAPYLIERLLKEGVVDSSAEGEGLFLEFKRWLQLTQSDRSKLWPIFSSHIDDVWHHFILYTREYTSFCEQYFGRYVHHTPSNAPKHPESERLEPVSFDSFCELYGRTFGEPPPEVWHSATHVKLHRRIVNAQAGQLQVRTNDLMLQLVNSEAREYLIHDADQTCHLVNVRGAEILRVGATAGDALEFIANTPAFYVRELPGNLESGEKIGLVATLVHLGILKVAT